MKGLTKKVRDIIAKLDITTPPVLLDEVAKLFSIKVIYYKDFPDTISGTIINEDEFFAIGINANKPINRQRFSLAHELGHFLLNHDIGDSLVDDVFDKPIDREREANEFASELLMPTDFINKDVDSGKKFSIPDLAERYQVSEQAMSVRLMKNNLLFKL